jgi:hypothetical protein
VEGRGGVGDDAYVLDYVLGEMDGMEGLNRENGEDGVDVGWIGNLGGSVLYQ